MSCRHPSPHLKNGEIRCSKCRARMTLTIRGPEWSPPLTKRQCGAIGGKLGGRGNKRELRQ